MFLKKSISLVILCSFNGIFTADKNRLKDLGNQLERLHEQRKEFCANSTVIPTTDLTGSSAQASLLSSLFFFNDLKDWVYSKLPYAKPTSHQKNVENFDKRILLLSLTFDENNLGIIKKELEMHPEFDINKKLQTDICGGLTLMHANLWLWRSYYAKPENRQIFLDTMQILLNRDADPDVAIPGCMIYDQQTTLVSDLVINNPYEHALFCGENELVQLFDIQRKKLGHVLKPQTKLVLFYAKDMLVMTGPQTDFDVTAYDHQIQVVNEQNSETDPVAQEVYNLATRYKKDNLQGIKELLLKIKDINGVFKPGLTLAHALLCHWRNENTNKTDEAHSVFIEVQKLFLQAGAQAHTKLSCCIIEDKPTRSQHQDVFNSLYEHALLTGDKKLYTLFPKNDDAKMVTFLLTWHADTDMIRWSTKRVEI